MSEEIPDELKALLGNIYDCACPETPAYPGRRISQGEQGALNILVADYLGVQYNPIEAILGAKTQQEHIILAKGLGCAVERSMGNQYAIGGIVSVLKYFSGKEVDSLTRAILRILEGAAASTKVTEIGAGA